MQFTSGGLSPKRAAVLAALGLTAIAPTAARAQTQDLYASIGGPNGPTISRFVGTGPGTFSTTPIMFAPGGGYLAFDARGDLFTTSGSNSITEFSRGTDLGALGSITTLTDPSLNAPQGLAVDARGDLFAANYYRSTITEFPAGATPGTFGTPTTLTGGGLNIPVGLAVDARGDLFAANLNGNSITEFRAGATPGTFGTPTTLNDPSLSGPTALAVDARGDLFAANPNTNGTGSITEFRAGATPGTFGTVLTFGGSGVDRPDALAVDVLGDLFVANGASANIVKFAIDPATGTFGTAQSFTTGFVTSALAFGPPLPEASTMVSFGLLLALGLGGMVVVAKKKKANRTA